MVPKHTFVTSMSDAPSLILRRLVLGMSVIVAPFSFFFSLSFPVLTLSSSSRKDAAERNPATTFRRLINYVDLSKDRFFLFSFFYQTSEPVSSDVLAKRKRKQNEEKVLYFCRKTHEFFFHR